MKKKKNKHIKPITYCHIAGIAGYITYVIAQVTCHYIAGYIKSLHSEGYIISHCQHITLQDILHVITLQVTININRT